LEDIRYPKQLTIDLTWDEGLDGYSRDT